MEASDNCDKGEINKEFLQLLENLAQVFYAPKGLPPLHSHDHIIVQKDGTQPISAQPYRYPQCQNIEIEKIVVELLTSGVIRLSSSPFFSPVLLVRKVDGSLRLCVDYWAFNQKIVKDKFFIPVIDKLMDGFYG